MPAIMLGVHATDWRDAVRIAGRALRLSGSTRAEYSDRMISVIEEFGAYVVVAPGLALAHARPGPDVRREGLAVITLAEPVAFGHPHNDPVRVVVGLAVSNAEEHVALGGVARQRLQRRHDRRAARPRHDRRRGARSARHRVRPAEPRRAIRRQRGSCSSTDGLTRPTGSRDEFAHARVECGDRGGRGRSPLAHGSAARTRRRCRP